MNIPYVFPEHQISPVPVRRCGRSGLYLPTLSLALRRCHNAWGHAGLLLRYALEAGVTHVDVSPPFGGPAAVDELKAALHTVRSRREEVTVSLQVGLGTLGMLQGFGSRQRVLSTLDTVLRRTDLDFVDILYAHRFDPFTPMEETAAALSSAISQGKALYAGLSGFSPAALRRFLPLLEDQGTPVTVCSLDCSLLNRWSSVNTFGLLEQNGVGCLITNPLAGGDLAIALPERPRDQQAQECITEARYQLTRLAAARRQTLPQLALSWALNDTQVTSILVDFSSWEELHDYCAAAGNTQFTLEELNAVDIACGSIFE
ncbi:putative L-glyceraldehyde-3-phosphate reductase [Streptomyces sp. NBRC 110611]|uniref:aldo/keto reductase n=1 Tax=Streptomyces sp. NBRC 110611 TaxID=1621259 RepID=UPI000835F0FA|nr:aldo/keto reductase [Streptomyces sp. NBRC 110611]GAU71277.1 putative L-glyceraldehyde-3-phosphate reductase [Streptomyces sp. NBRC 110611]